jgi:hypothetical protein
MGTLDMSNVGMAASGTVTQSPAATALSNSIDSLETQLNKAMTLLDMIKASLDHITTTNNDPLLTALKARIDADTAAIAAKVVADTPANMSGPGQ